MCNCLHTNSRLLDREKGVGFKIFGPNNTSMVGSNEYVTAVNDWVHWHKTKFNQGIGFCVFVDEEEAMRCCKLWVNAGSWNHGCNVKRVRYSGAVAEHIEDSIITSGHDRFTVRLVKRFKILEEGK